MHQSIGPQTHVDLLKVIHACVRACVRACLCVVVAANRFADSRQFACRTGFRDESGPPPLPPHQVATRPASQLLEHSGRGSSSGAWCVWVGNRGLRLHVYCHGAIAVARCIDKNLCFSTYIRACERLVKSKGRPHCSLGTTSSPSVAAAAATAAASYGAADVTAAVAFLPPVVELALALPYQHPSTPLVCLEWRRAVAASSSPPA